MRNIFFSVFISSLIILSSCDNKDNSTGSKPAAPDNLQYTLTSNKLTLTWIDNSTNEDEFHIQRKSDLDDDWVTIWRTPANETSYEMNVYQVYPNPAFRVTAWSISGESEPSNTIYVPTYQSANLMIFICPNFYDGCSASYLVVDQNCRTLQNANPGEWYNTGFLLTTNHNYAIQFCGGCISNCGAASALLTPRAFLTTTFYSTIYGFCKNACSPPENSYK
ncbi:MAG: fibronectin type III domain-containing protein [Bacteroidales bacterium]